MLHLEGQVFARLTVLEFAGRIAGKRTWLCQCECGNTTTVIGTNLVRGETRSCGCLMLEKARANGRATRRHGHGASRSPTYRSWESMKRRCLSPVCCKWKHYGGRGIAVCERWLESFENFLADMGERPEGTTLDRIDVNGNYEPGNCRWATVAEQRGNRTDSIRVVA